MINSSRSIGGLLGRRAGVVTAILPSGCSMDQPLKSCTLGIGVLGIPGRDCCIRARQACESEESGTIPDVVDIGVGDGPQAAVPQQGDVIGPEITEVGLLGG